MSDYNQGAMNWYQAFLYGWKDPEHQSRVSEVRIHYSGVEVKIAGEIHSFSPGDLEFTYGGDGNDKMKIRIRHFDQDFSVMIKDKKIFKEVKKASLSPEMQELIRFFHKDGSNKRMNILAWVGGVLIGGTLLVWGTIAGFGALVKSAASAIPIDFQRELGEVAAAEIMISNAMVDYPEAQELVDSIGERLEISAETEIDFEYIIVDDHNINAFALPGGLVFINRGLIEKAGSTDELAGVIAHEMVHIIQSHGLRNVINSIGLMVAASIIFGEVEGAAMILIETSASLGTLAYSREQETEADTMGLDLLYKAGFEPNGMVDFFEKLQETEVSLDLPIEIFSTHPETQRRAQTLREIIESTGPQTSPWMDKPSLDLDWSRATEMNYFDRE